MTWWLPVVIVLATLLALSVGALTACIVHRPVANGQKHPEEPSAPSESSVEDDLVVGLVSAHDLAGDNLAVRRSVEQTLRTAGITPLDPGPGVGFDPDFHVAVSTRTAAPGEAAGTVVEVVRPGWVQRGVVLRPAEVVVVV